MWEGFPLFPEQASTFAAEVDALYLAFVGVSAFFTVGIFLTILFFAIKYRRRSEDEIPPAMHGNLALEVTWIAVPLIIASSLLLWGMKLYLRQFEPPGDAIEIAVVGKQWMWKLQHPGGQSEINELHVPVGRKIMLRMATEDVIHSFFIPAFRVKHDVVPGRYSMVWFQPTRVGEYHLFCAEYCGSKHSQMIGRVVVMEPSEFQQWLRRNEPAELPVVAGARLFEEHGCQSCHQEVDSRRGPALAGLYGSRVRLASGDTVTADEHYLREAILNPRAKQVAGYPPLMPVFRNQLSEENVLRLLAYIKSLPAPAAEKTAELR